MLTSLRYVTQEQTPYPSVTLRHIFAYTPLPSKGYVTFERPLLADHKELATAFARIVAAKPHSADVERLIKSYNLIKTEDRANLSSITLKNYLYIRHNMPLVSEFNPRPCVLKWLNDKERRDVLPKRVKNNAGLLQCSKKHMKKLRKKQLHNQKKLVSEKILFSRIVDNIIDIVEYSVSIIYKINIKFTYLECVYF